MDPVPAPASSPATFDGTAFAAFGDKFRRGFALTQKHAVLAWAAGFAYWLVSNSQSRFNFPTDTEHGALAWALVAFAVVVLCAQVALFFAYPVVAVGYLRMQEAWLRGESPTFAVLLNAEGKYLTVLGLRVLCMLATAAPLLPGVAALGAGIYFAVTEGLDGSGSGMGAVGVACFIAGGILVFVGVFAAVYIALGLYLAERIAVFENKRAVDAMRQSWSYARGNRTSLFLFLFLAGLIVLASVVAGVLALCVGLFVFPALAMSLTQTATTHAYLTATRGPAPPLAHVVT
jgi:hypothetical protein